MMALGLVFALWVAFFYRGEGERRTLLRALRRRAR
jgi:hypothetical protein